MKKSKRLTPAQKLSEAWDQNILMHKALDDSLHRLELLVMEMGWHAEMLERAGAPRSAASSAKISAEIEEFCKATRAAHGFDHDIPL